MSQVAFIVSVLTVAGIYALLTLGLNVQWGETGLLNFGHVAFFAVGAYTSALVTVAPPGEMQSYVFGFGLPIPVGIVAACLAAGVVAVVIGYPTLQLREDYLAMVSIGLAEILRYVFINEKWLTGGASGIYGIPQPLTGTVPTSMSNYVFLAIVGAGLAACYAYAQRLSHSPFGRVLRAIREDADVARAVGVDTFSYRMQAFVIGAMIAGFAGALWAHYATALTPMAFEPSITFLTWVALIVGGSGNPRGAVVGAFLIIGFRELTRYLPDVNGLTEVLPSLRLILVGVLVIAIVRYRPEGLLPERHLSHDDYAQRVRSGRATTEGEES